MQRQKGGFDISKYGPLEVARGYGDSSGNYVATLRYRQKYVKVFLSL